MTRNARFWIGMALYAMVLIWSVRFLKTHPQSEWRIPVRVPEILTRSFPEILATPT